MATDSVGEEAWKSVRLVWREELWLPLGLPIAAVAYGLWIGLTGAAVTFLAKGIGGQLTVSPWTPMTDLVVVTLSLLWILGPAALAALLVRDRVTNVRGNLATGYRLRHPSLLLAPPVVLLAAGLAALSYLGRAPAVVQAVLVAGAIWIVLRTVAYTYRVFALSLPLLGHVVAFVATLLGAVATLVLGAQAVGRGPLAADVAAGLAARTGVDALGALPDGAMLLAGAAVPTVVWALVTIPVAIAAGYLALQTLASLGARLRRPTVRRPQLRTGQRYPAFARPTASVAGGGRSGAAEAGVGVTSGPEPSGDGEASTGAATSDYAEEASAGDDESDRPAHVSHTRVYTPPDETEPEPEAVAGWTAKRPRCPVCGEPYDPDAVEGTCPDCGADLGS